MVGIWEGKGKGGSESVRVRESDRLSVKGLQLDG